ncbi:MAG: beta-lactamase induction signal transducer protein [Clostridia bacterium]|nr:beta-lactamase induction signal transducer protein [Clostridia bacterium]MBR6185625.1 beta-lactamase induction signal transducer protein [Clostridia bacterium]
MIGFALAIILKKEKPIGTLRVDRSDPDEAPYLFLELEQNGMERIRQSKTVVLKVDLNGYLPRN